MRAQKSLLLLLLPLGISLGTSPLRGESASDLLDRAIWWPGDYAQMCRGDGNGGPFRSVPIQGYGPALPQEYFLSKDTLAKLMAQREAVVREMALRLRALDWNKIPPAPPVSAEAQRLAAKVRRPRANPAENGPVPGPRKHENPRALGATFLRIIAAMEAVELLPELLRLEDDLNRLNEAAVDASWSPWEDTKKVPKVPVPAIETGWSETWAGWTEEWESLGRPQDHPALKWKGRVFDNILFQREILGTCLGLLDKKAPALLRDSWTGRLHTLATRRDRYEVLLPGSDEVRDDARKTLQAFIAGQTTAGPPVDGAALLEESIATPGFWNQMCAFPPPMEAEPPMPPQTRLIARHFNLGTTTIQRLQAYRAEVMPVLVARLQALKIESPPPPPKRDPAQGGFNSKRSGQTSTEFGPLIFQVVEKLNAVECLPELLRLEQELHDLLSAAEKDPAMAVPALRLDSPLSITQPDEKTALKAALDKAGEQRQSAIVTCRVYQRELLGLIRALLLMEAYPPMKDSALEKEQQQAGRETFRKKNAPELAAAKNYDDIPRHLQRDVEWDEAKRQAIINENAFYLTSTPYTAAVREEVRGIARQFLKDVPPAKRKAADAMPLGWIDEWWEAQYEE